MTTIQFMLKYWQINLPMLIVSALLITLYLYAYNNKLTFAKNRHTVNRKSMIFFSGIILILVCSMSPMDFLSRYYLFSAHMVEHVIFLLIIPPLLLNGLDQGFLERIAARLSSIKVVNIIFKPSVSWMIGVGSMWVLHIPFIFIALHHSYFLMTLQMIVLLISGTIFIWPIYSPVQENRINPLQRVIYLFTACVGCSVLGILITFTPVNLYDSCMIGFNEDILSVIRFNWGITPPIDQQFGGLIMWLPACMIYLTNVLITIFQWYESDEVEKIENNVKVSNKQF